RLRSTAIFRGSRPRWRSSPATVIARGSVCRSPLSWTVTAVVVPSASVIDRHILGTVCGARRQRAGWSLRHLVAHYIGTGRLLRSEPNGPPRPGAERPEPEPARNPRAGRLR